MQAERIARQENIANIANACRTRLRTALLFCKVEEAPMQQRLAYTLFIQISKRSSPLNPTVETFHATVQTMDEPVTRHFRSLRQLKQWLEAVIPPHTSAPLVPISKAPLRKI